MNVLMILNDSPYGTERVYNALRLAHSLARDGHCAVTIFLVGDAVVSARAGQKTPAGYYNAETMLKRVALSGGKVLLCGTCMDARGLPAEQMMDGAERSTMDALARLTLGADKVLVF